MPPRVNALTIYLDQEHWLEEPIVVARLSRGESWIIFEGESKREVWFFPFTQTLDGEVRCDQTAFKDHTRFAQIPGIST